MEIRVIKREYVGRKARDLASEGAREFLRDKKRAVSIFHELQNNISVYLFTITLINVGLGTLVGVGVMLLHMLGGAAALTIGLLLLVAIIVALF